MKRILVWDLPTRTFHWLLASVCIVAWVTGDDARYTHLHTFCGYTALALVIFRVLWGVVGGRYARFSQFLRGPAAVFQHLKELGHRSQRQHPGHNPAGAWAIILLLGLVLLLGLSGIVVLGGEEGFGPLAGMLSVAQGVAAHQLHEGLAWALLAVVNIHLLGVFFESFLRRENLVRAMVHGYKRDEDAVAETRNAGAVAGVMLSIFVVAVFWNVKPYLSDTEENPFLPYPQKPLAQNVLWQEACGECHLAYHPSLLPRRSWQRLMAEQDAHFGEDLALESVQIEQLLSYARAHSAEENMRELSWRTLRELKETEVVLRITETPYWKVTHVEIDETLWKHQSVAGRLNCQACHIDAEQGGFSNGAMRLPH